MAANRSHTRRRCSQQTDAISSRPYARCVTNANRSQRQAFAWHVAVHARAVFGVPITGPRSPDDEDSLRIVLRYALGEAERGEIRGCDPFTITEQEAKAAMRRHTPRAPADA